MTIHEIALFYGHAASNIGDLAINSGQIQIIKDLYPTAKVNVILMNGDTSRFLDAAKASYGGYSDVNFVDIDTSDVVGVADMLARPEQLFERLGIGEVDLVLGSAGEHVFQYSNGENCENLFWRLFPIYAAKVCGKRAGIFPSTFGPFEDEESKELCLAVFSMCDFVAAREDRSYELLRQEFLGDQARKGLDPAFFIETDRRTGQSRRPTVALIMRSEGWGIRLSKQQRTSITNSLRSNDYKNSLSFQVSQNLLKHIRLRHGHDVVIFVQTDADKEMAELLLEQATADSELQGLIGSISVRRPESVTEYVADLADVDQIITSRFHAAILGLILGKEVHGLFFHSHGHKMPGLFSMLGLADRCFEVTPDRLEEAVCAVQRNLEIGAHPEQVLQRIDRLKHEFLLQFQSLENRKIDSHTASQAQRLFEKMALLGAVQAEQSKSAAVERQLASSRDRLAQTREELKQAKAEIQRNITTLRELERRAAAAERTEKTLAITQELLSVHRDKLQDIQRSGSYQIAHLLSREARQSPLLWILTPAKVLLTFYRIRQRRRGKAESTQGKRGGRAPVVLTDEREIWKYLPQRSAGSIGTGKPIKRICYVLHNSLPYASGGYATRAHGVATGLLANGYEVICLTRPGFPLDIKNNLSPEDVEDHEIDGVLYKRILTPMRRKSRPYDYMESIIGPIEEAITQIAPDLVIAASFYHTAFPAMVAARKLDIPFVYEIRGLAEITAISRNPRYADSVDYKTKIFMEAETSRQADHVITLTNAMRDEIVGRGVDSQKFTILPNSTDATLFSPRARDGELAASLGISDGVAVIGYIGTFVDYEGLEDLVTAAGRLRKSGRTFRLLIVGSDNVNATETGPITRLLQETAKSSGVDDWLIMPGRVPHHQVEKFYSLIDIAAFPRKPWPVCEMVSPMKPLEAMAMSKTIVVSSVDALQHMVRHGETGMVFDKGSVSSLTQVLNVLLSDPSLIRRLGENARAWVSTERTWKYTTDKAMQDLLSRLGLVAAGQLS